jgi:hypothetical protein
MYQFKWDHASSIKANFPTHKPLLVKKSDVPNYTITMQTKLRQGAVLVLNYMENV